MSEPFIAEIRIFAGNFAPRGWAFCNGQLLPIAQNTTLYSLIGTTYGGDGHSTTALPNLQGKAPMHPGRGPGLTARRLGQERGVETVTLSAAQISNHTHQEMTAERRAQNEGLSATSTFSETGETTFAIGATAAMAPQPVQPVGDSQPHNNMQPYLAINFIIALVGLYPSRS
jgi:microcystin-dependent protein